MAKSRIIIALLFIVFALEFTLPAFAQSSRIPLVGLLIKGSKAEFARLDQAFQNGLENLGYSVGKSIRIEYAAAKGRPERLPELAENLVRKKVDVIVTLGGAPVLAAMRATKSIPIVIGVGGDFIAAGYVKSLNRPGGNVTGLSTLAPDLTGKQLQILREILPGLTKVAVIRVPGIAHDTMVNQGKVYARQLGIQIVPIIVNSSADLPNAFQRMKYEKVNAFIVLRSGFLVGMRHQIAARALEAGLPSMFGHVHEAQAGGLIAYGADTNDLFQEAARFVDKILNGSNPADLPVFQSRRFILTVNLKTANALGTKIPPSILFRATRVIE